MLYSTGSSTVMILISGTGDLGQSAIERRRFSATRGAGDQNDSVRQFDQFVEGVVNIVGHADALKVEDHPLLVEQTQHDPFTVEHRDDRHTHIDLAPLDTDVDSSVLRESFFGNVQAGHDLQSRDDRVRKLMDLRREWLDAEHAVDAKADREPFLLRLDMDIARSLFEGFDQQLVHQLDDGRSLGRLSQFTQLIGDGIEEFNTLFETLRDQQIDGVATDTQRLLDQLHNLITAGEYRFDPTCRPARRVRRATRD